MSVLRRSHSLTRAAKSQGINLASTSVAGGGAVLYALLMRSASVQRMLRSSFLFLIDLAAFPQTGATWRTIESATVASSLLLASRALPVAEAMQL